MTRATVARATQAPKPHHRISSLLRGLSRSRQLLVGVALTGLLAVWAGLLLVKWPFTQAVVLRSLQGELHEPVQVGAFHPTLFPPGYIAEGIHPVPSSQKPTMPTVAIRRLVVRANYSDLLLLRKNVEQIFLFGIRVQVPSVPQTTRAPSSSRSTPLRFAQIRHVQIEDAVVAFPTLGSPDAPFTVTIQKAELEGVTRTRPASFRAELVTNKPQGALHTNGQIGPWNWEEPGRTPLSGVGA